MKRVYIIADLVWLITIIVTLLAMVFFHYTPSHFTIGVLLGIVFLTASGAEKDLARIKSDNMDYHYFVAYQYGLNIPNSWGYGNIFVSSNNDNPNEAWYEEIRNSCEKNLRDKYEIPSPKVIITNVIKVAK